MINTGYERESYKEELKGTSQELFCDAVHLPTRDL